jgi:hypothetical protein
MKNQFQPWAAWIFARIQFASANFDVEVLQWPGGSVIAVVLWIYLTARSLWWVGTAKHALA